MSEEKLKLPIGLKIAIGYLIISGVVGLIWPLTGLGPHHEEFISKSASYKLGAHAKDLILNALLVISGIGLFYRKTWAQKMVIVSLILGIIYGTNDFAWGMAKGQPNANIYLVSLAALSLWNVLWLFLIFKKSSRSVFPQKETPRTLEFFKLAEKDQLMLKGLMVSIPLLNIPHLWIINPMMEFSYNRFIALIIGLSINLLIVYWSFTIKKAPELFFRLIPAVFWITIIFDGYGIFSSIKSGQILSYNILFSGLKIAILFISWRAFFKYKKATSNTKNNAIATT